MNNLTYGQLIFRLHKLILGFFIISVGIVLMKNAHLGMNPWGTFHLGIHYRTGVSFGRISQLTGLTVIAISLLLRIKPGLATILNMILIGAFVDFIDFLSILPQPEQWYFQIILLVVGTTLFSYGIFYYLMSGFGGGPRDGLMIGLVTLTHLPIKVIKSAIELLVITIGFFLGGPVGIGTIISVFLGSFILDWLFSYHNVNPKSIPRINLKELIIK